MRIRRPIAGQFIWPYDHFRHLAFRMVNPTTNEQTSDPCSGRGRRSCLARRRSCLPLCPGFGGVYGLRGIRRLVRPVPTRVYEEKTRVEPRFRIPTSRIRAFLKVGIRPKTTPYPQNPRKGPRETENTSQHTGWGIETTTWEKAAIPKCQERSDSPSWDADSPRFASQDSPRAQSRHVGTRSRDYVTQPRAPTSRIRPETRVGRTSGRQILLKNS